MEHTDLQEEAQHKRCGRPKKYLTEEERKKANCEYVKRCNLKKNPTDINDTPKKRGPKPKYSTEGEKLAARQEAVKKYSHKKQKYETVGRPVLYETEEQKREADILKSQRYRDKVWAAGSTEPTTFEEYLYESNKWIIKHNPAERTVTEDKDLQRESISFYKDILVNLDKPIPFTLKEWLKAYKAYNYFADEFDIDFRVFATECNTRETFIYYILFSGIMSITNEAKLIQVLNNKMKKLTE